MGASKEFRGEIWTGIHPRVLEAMVQANAEEVDGCVGQDGYSQRAIRWLRERFSSPLWVTYTLNGTAANVLAMKTMLHPWGAVLCGAETHVNVYECGATEFATGAKILYVDSPDGKLTPEGVDRYLALNKKYKYRPEVAVVTQPTELGTVYTVEELKALVAHLHSLGMAVYLDGARLPVALVKLGISLEDFIETVGVDAFSLGGTKAGCLFGEMLAFRREEWGRNLDYSQKQSLQHLDKSRYLGAGFCALLEDGLYLENARLAHENAKKLEKRLAEIGRRPYYPVEANAVFTVLTPEELARVNEVYDFHYWNEETHTVRFVTTYGTKEEEMDRLVSLLA